MNTELLVEVRDFIRAHPRNVDMGAFERETKSCGTVGCIAGWACMLTGSDRDQVASYHSNAAYLLGISTYDADKLFYTINWPYAFLTRLSEASGQAYANVVADRIDYFIETGL